MCLTPVFCKRAPQRLYPRHSDRMPSPPQQPRLHGFLFLDLSVPLKEKMPNTGWGVGGSAGAAAVNFITLKRNMASPHLHENVSAPWESRQVWLAWSLCPGAASQSLCPLPVTAKSVLSLQLHTEYGLPAASVLAERNLVHSLSAPATGKCGGLGGCTSTSLFIAICILIT